MSETAVTYNAGSMVKTESLADAVDRLLDCLERNHHNRVQGDVSLNEAVDLAYRAYLRERKERDELPSEFPDIGLVMN